MNTNYAEKENDQKNLKNDRINFNKPDNYPTLQIGPNRRITKNWPKFDSDQIELYKPRLYPIFHSKHRSRYSSPD